MKKNELTPIQIQNIKNLYADGVSITKISDYLKISRYRVTKVLREANIEVINHQNLISYDLQTDIIPLYEKGISLTKIAEQFKTTRNTLSKHLKRAGYTIINHQNKTKFNENIFDVIDTEEKAYWLGFIFADGYIDSSPLLPTKKSRYTFEVSLKGNDIEHLDKFNNFMEHNKNNVKLGEIRYNNKIVTRCRWGIVNKHLWERLNELGCIPNKSTILSFPSKTVFKNNSLIISFIRGYFDGDGCLSYIKTNHSETPNYSVVCSFLGTFEFLSKIKEILEDYQIYSGSIKQDNRSNVYELKFSQNNSRKLLKLLYENSTIYLDRKYKRAMFFKENCRSAEELAELLQSENGEGCE